MLFRLVLSTIYHIHQKKHARASDFALNEYAYIYHVRGLYCCVKNVPYKDRRINEDYLYECEQYFQAQVQV